MLLTKEELELLKNIPNFKFTESKVLYKGTAIPSKLFPINDKKNMRIFYVGNTEEIQDEPLLEDIFNNVEMNIGHCYTNCKNIVEECLLKNIQDVVPYVGWVSVSSTRLIHHCWLVYKGKHIIDGSAYVNIFNEVYSKITNNISMDEVRKLMVDFHFKVKNMPNSSKYVFGRALNYYIYVGSPCSPNDGIAIFQKLMKEFPKHPSYLNISSDGSNKLQRMIFKQESK